VKNSKSDEELKPWPENAGAQVYRMSSMDYFPQAEDAKFELIRVLSRGAKSDEHAGRIIDKWIYELKSAAAPKPAELAELCRTVDAIADRPKRQRCGECIDGWVTGQFLITHSHGQAGGSYKTVELLSDEEADNLIRQIAARAAQYPQERRNQMVYGGARRCGCNPEPVK